MTLQIRAAQVSDAAAIAEVQVRTWRAAYEGLMPAQTLAAQSVARRTEQWAQRLQPSAGSLVLVAAEEGQVIGFVAVGASRDEEAGPHGAEVYAIYVQPERWGSGAGHRLWAEPLGGTPVREVRYRLSLNDSPPTGA